MKKYNPMQMMYYFSVAFLFCDTVYSQDIVVSPYFTSATITKEKITSLAISNESNLILIGDADDFVHIWNVKKRQFIKSIEFKNEILFCNFLSTEDKICVVDVKGNVCIYDFIKNEIISQLKTLYSPQIVVLDIGKRYLSILNSNNNIEIYDLKSMMLYGQIDGHGELNEVLFLGYDRLGQQIIALSKYGEVTAWNPLNLKRLRKVTLTSEELHGSRNIVHSASTNRSANVFVINLEEVALPRGGLGGMARPTDLVRQNYLIAYDWESGIEIKKIRINNPIENTALGPGNDNIICSFLDQNVLSIVDLRKGELINTFSVVENITSICVSEKNDLLVAGNSNGMITIWTLQYIEVSGAIKSSIPSLSGRIRTSSGFEPALKSGQLVKLAILNFEAKGVSQEIADICLNSLSNGLANFDYITLIERNQIDAIIKEQRLQESGLINEKTSVELGKLLSADNVLLCSIGRLGNSMLLTARLLSVESGKILKGREVICEECRDQDIFDAVKTLVSTIAQ